MNKYDNHWIIVYELQQHKFFIINILHIMDFKALFGTEILTQTSRDASLTLQVITPKITILQSHSVLSNIEFLLNFLY